MSEIDLEAIAESDEHARWVVEHHVPNLGLGGTRFRCGICEAWYPCDLVGLAALAVLNAQKAAGQAAGGEEGQG